MTQIVWLDELSEAQRWEFRQTRFRIGETDYHVGTAEPSAVPLPGFCILKPPGLIDATIALLEACPDANIVELGINKGGGTALYAQVAKPRKLVALELAAEPVEMLRSFIEVNDYGETVRPYYGVDQSDKARIEEILDAEFGDEPIDLVVDDASHRLDETRASFDILFPRVRPGGQYVIEDWNWEHVWQARLHEELAKPDSPVRAAFDQHATARPASRSPAPLSTFVMELLLARAWSGDVVSALVVEDLWVKVMRGNANLGTEFHVADAVHDHFGLLAHDA